MKIRVLMITAIFALFLSVMPINAFAVATTVSIDAVTAKNPGDQVTITGTTNFPEVIVKFLRPDNTVLYVDVLSVSNGHFTANVKLPSDTPTGTYKIVVGQNSNVDTENLVVNAAPIVIGGGGGGGVPSTPDPSPTPSPSNSGQVMVKLDDSSQTVKKTSENGKSVTTVSIDANKLASSFADLKKQSNDDANKDKEQVIAVEVKNADGEAKVQLPASALADAAKEVPNAVVSIQSGTSSYQLPLKVLDIAALAQSLGASADQVNINVTIAPIVGSEADQVKSAVKSLGASSVGEIIDFNVTAESNGKTVTISSFGSTYVSRVIGLSQSVDPNQATALFIDPVTGQASFVPAVFRTTADGKTEVVIKRNGNSIYTVASSAKTFADVNNHWAKNDINLLASKMIISGISKESFKPDNQITRAEFATILVHALGLSTSGATSNFTDIKASDWYAGTVAAAVEAGLVSGVSKGEFKPNTPISREEIAVILSKSLALLNKSSIETTKTAAALAKFKDQAEIDGWAKDAAAQLADLQIINGKTDTTFAPKAIATRAETAVLLKKVLQFVNFIN